MTSPIPSRQGQFTLSGFLVASALTPPIFGVYAGAFGEEMQLLAVLVGLAGIGLAVYLALALAALSVVYAIPMLVWRCCQSCWAAERSGGKRTNAECHC